MSNVLKFPDLISEKIEQECKDIIHQNLSSVIDEIKPRLKMVVSDLSHIGRKDLEHCMLINSAGDRYLLTMKFEPV